MAIDVETAYKGVGFSVTVAGRRRVPIMLKIFPGLMHKALLEAAEEATEIVEDQTKENLNNVILHRRSSTLFNSTTRFVEDKTKTVVGVVGIKKLGWYGKIHEMNLYEQVARKKAANRKAGKGSKRGKGEKPKGPPSRKLPNLKPRNERSFLRLALVQKKREVDRIFADRIGKAARELR